MIFNHLKKLFLASLRKQLIMGITITVATTMSFFVWDVTRQQQVNNIEQNTQEATALAKSVAASSSIWVASHDLSGLEEIIGGLIRYPDLRYAIVLDLKGQVLAHTDSTRIGQYLLDLPHPNHSAIVKQLTNGIEVNCPIKLAEKQIGWVRVSLSTVTVDTHIRKMINEGISLSLIAISISIVVAIVAGSVLTGRLSAIQKVADFVQAGDTNIRVKLSGEDEAALLSRRFDSMLDTLEEREKELLKANEKTLALLRNASDGIHILNSDGILIEASDSFVSMLGYHREELIGAHASRWDAKLSATELSEKINIQLSKQVRSQFETCHKRKDGTIFDVEVSGFPLDLEGKKVLFNSSRDITERKRSEEKLLITASVFNSSQEAIVITDSGNNIIDVNPAFTKITGYEQYEVLGKNPKILNSGHQGKEFYTQLWETLNRDKAWRGEIWNRRKSGEIYPEMLSISTLCDNDGKVLRHVAVFSDISHLKKHEEELKRVAHYDPLTGIPNRLLLADRMQQGISQTSRDKNIMAVCYLDLDGFKPINDTSGHEVGDKILVEVSKRIEKTIRGGDTVARLGGDEFVILLLDLEKGEECLTTLERLLKAIAEPINFQDKTLKISASIGVSIYPTDNEDPDTLMRHADQAMYVAKESGKNRFHIYDVEMDKRARNQNEFLQSIRNALKQNQFELYYQPKINLRTKELVGVEALIRWRHSERGVLPPSEFLRQIENTGLDIEIGEWVMATALNQLVQWRKEGLDIDVGINISGYHLESSSFVGKLEQLLSLYPDLPPNKLQIEVLETVALNDINVVREIIGACRELGVTFALDDFGTGYSSLSYLYALPVDALKIDQTFVRDMLEDDGDRAIVLGVIALAKAFKRLTIAEGIETTAHIQVLDGMGCEFGQGYGIALPMPASELIRWKSSYL
jgi:diguanylate cyclase (GGDEF)-like protein/PAS domain S-box-containing protein